jgi:hypothetical protein
MGGEQAAEPNVDRERGTHKEQAARERSKQIVNQYLPAVKALATALLAKDWVPQVRLESGAQWSEETTTTEKHMTCEEVVNLLKQYGIPAVCGPTS